MAEELDTTAAPRKSRTTRAGSKTAKSTKSTASSRGRSRTSASSRSTTRAAKKTTKTARTTKTTKTAKATSTGTRKTAKRSAVTTSEEAAETARSATARRKTVAARKRSTRSSTSKAAASADLPEAASQDAAAGDGVESVDTKETSGPARRAPTRHSDTAQVMLSWRDRIPPVPHMVTGFVVVGLLISSVVVGVSDPGEVDIRSVVEERNRLLQERQAQGEPVEEELLSVQDSRNTQRPRLRPAASRSTPPPSIEEPADIATTSTSTSAATSTDAAVAGNATTTDNGAEEAEDGGDTAETDTLEFESAGEIDIDDLDADSAATDD